MRRLAFALALALAALAAAAPPAPAAPIVITTESAAAQTLISPLFGQVDIVAYGTQVFTIDPVAVTAGVTSDLTGADFPDPVFGTASYDLYNTQTKGTVTPDGTGGFVVHFDLLFELAVTSGLLNGVVFETVAEVAFEADVPALPFPAGTQFSSPLRPNDQVTVYLKTDNGFFASLGILPGAPVGVSQDRVVTINAVVPEPASLALAGVAAAGLAGARVRRGRRA